MWSHLPEIKQSEQWLWGIEISSYETRQAHSNHSRYINQCKKIYSQELVININILPVWFFYRTKSEATWIMLLFRIINDLFPNQQMTYLQHMTYFRINKWLISISQNHCTLHLILGIIWTAPQKNLPK
jgi:hypothetical protein